MGYQTPKHLPFSKKLSIMDWGNPPYRILEMATDQGAMITITHQAFNPSVVSSDSPFSVVGGGYRGTRR